MTSSDDIRRAILKIAREPEFREELRRALGIAEIDPAVLLERIDRNTEAIARNTEAILELRQDFERSTSETRAEMAEFRKDMAEFRIQMAAMRKEFQDEMAVFHRVLASGQRRSDALGARWGLLAEESFREGMATVVADLVPDRKVRKWRYKDEEGVVYGHPAWVEVDVAIEDGGAVLIEVKSSAGRAEVAALARIAKLYETVEARQVTRILLVSPFVDPTVDPTAEPLARTLGIEVSTATGEP